MSDFYLTNDAEQDLVKIRDYTVDNWGIEQSTKYLTELKTTFLLITENSSIGTRCEDIGKNVFSFPHASHVMYYTIRNETVVFFAVLHKSMIPKNHLLNRER